MVAACLISTIINWTGHESGKLGLDDPTMETYDTMDGPSEEEVYLQGTMMITARKR
jgi:hypothetical protein